MSNAEKHIAEPGEILIVDDDHASLQLLTEILGSHGYRVRPASSGRLALRTVAIARPDLILLDVKMPDIDGYEVCRRLKAEQASCDIPVIFISGLYGTAEKVKGFDAGGVDYITKPLQPEEILARVKTHLELNRLQLQMKKAYEEVEMQVRQRTAELYMVNAELRESERKFKNIFDNIQDGYIMADMDGTILLVNPASAQTLGYDSTGELIGRNMAAEVYGRAADRETVKAILADRGRVDDYELEFRRKNGENIPVSCSIHLVTDRDGQPVALEGLFRDISERRKAGEELKQSQRLLQSMFEAIPGLVNVLDKDLNIVYSNWHDHEYVTAKERADNPKCYRVFLKKDNPCPDCHVGEIFATGKPRTVEVFNSVHGRYKEVSTFPVFDEEGKVRYVVEHATDINERKQAELALRAEKEKLETLTRNMGVGLTVIAKDYRILWANQVLKEIFGDVEGKICHETYNKQTEICPGCGVRQVLATGQGPVIHEQKGIDLNGNEVWSEIIVTPIRDGQGNITSALEVLVPINDRKRAEEEKEEIEKQLRQAQKMESVGTLAGGIAHDFNNILTAVLGYADMVLEGLAPGSRNWKLQQEVINAGLRAKELVKQILTFSRQTEHDFKPLQLHLIIKETLKLLRASIPTTIEIRQDIDASCGAVLADPTQIHQVLLNLCTNSYHAMREKGGVLEVCLRETVIGQDDHIANLELTPGKYAKLSVSDTGAGIRLEDMEKIFEPYFTTKPVDEGTGLGLSVVHGIVKSHKGRITVYSEPGKGTVFNLYFPCIAAAGETGEARSDELLPGGNERILVVDDEEFIVRIEQFILENLGYRITATTSSKEALRIFSQQPTDFDLVITDMTMPHLTGADLARKFLAIRPDIPLILCTGFNAQINKETAKEIGIREFALKPVSKRDLAYMVRRALDDAQQGWQKNASIA
ncbi:MAG: response regulator [Thermodesulfobacteriota bacterium]